LESYADWVMAVSSIVTIGVTSALAYYAYVTINEGRKDRRKDTIEKKLTDAFSPLSAILLKARDRGRKIDPSTWAFDQSEINQIEKAVSNFGHYLDKTQRARIREILKQKSERPPTNQTWRFQESEIAKIFDYIEHTRDELVIELEELTKGPRPKVLTTTAARSPSNEVVSDMPYKSRLERFDEVFRTLLVIATVLLAIHLASNRQELLPAIFAWVLLLVLAITVWSIAALWDTPWACFLRIWSLQMLSVYFVAVVSQTCVNFATSLVNLLKVRFSATSVISLVMAVISDRFFEFRLLAMALFSLLMTVLGRKYLQLKLRETLLALLVWIVLVIILSAITMLALHG